MNENDQESMLELLDKIDELKEQIDQLSNDNHVLKTSFIIQQEQTEKMKNVGNCKHAMECAKWVEQRIYHNNGKCCKNCKDWELAE